MSEQKVIEKANCARCYFLALWSVHHFPTFGCRCLKWTLGFTKRKKKNSFFFLLFFFKLTALSYWIKHLQSISMVITSSSSVEDKTMPSCRIAQSEPWINSAVLHQNKSQYLHSHSRKHTDLDKFFVNSLTCFSSVFLKIDMRLITLQWFLLNGEFWSWSYRHETFSPVRLNSFRCLFCWVCVV